MAGAVMAHGSDVYAYNRNIRYKNIEKWTLLKQTVSMMKYIMSGCQKTTLRDEMIVRA